MDMHTDTARDLDRVTTMDMYTETETDTERHTETDNDKDRDRDMETDRTAHGQAHKTLTRTGTR
jgi:hypothetical protein